METGKRCLIVVDYQKDFVDGSLGFEKAVTLDHGIAEKIRLASAVFSTRYCTCTRPPPWNVSDPLVR